ncbi:unnamed protein product [Symbiodinium necroappetens]|uniref:SAM domain-containing protein n=1 Tax=Symbiodinium necroappetens TaxID=1628268 RepID=A0A812QJ45_9DINO|nr:unnamed protein product [Symbiodinium necroappetens]
MDSQSVADWLASLGPAYQKYLPKFQEESVDGLLLMELTDVDLQEMGIAKLHCKKILAHRADLAARGLNKTVCDQRNLDRMYESSEASVSKGSSEMLMPRRFAGQVLNGMRRSGKSFSRVVDATMKQIDALLCDQQEEVLLLETVEAMNLFVGHRTAHVDAGHGHGCARDEVREDLQQIVQGKRMARSRSAVLYSKIRKLAAAITKYCKVVTNGASTEKLKVEAKSQLDRSFAEVKDGMLNQVREASCCNTGLLVRARDRLQSQIPGGAAVRANIDAMAKLMKDSSAAAENCKQIYNLADPEVQLALEARSGVLNDIIKAEEEELGRLHGRRDRVTQQLTVTKKQRAKYEQILTEQANATKDIRDWHIKRFWRWSWKDEMKVYQDQVEEDAQRNKKDAQSFDETCLELEEKLSQIGSDIEKKTAYIASLKRKNSQKHWQTILQAEGLIALEDEVKETEQKLQVIRGQLLQAMQETGVADPVMAAQIITQHEKSKILLSETTAKSSEVAVRMEELLSQVEGLVQPGLNDTDLLTSLDTEDLEPLSEAMHVINDRHEEHMRFLANHKAQVFGEVVNKAAEELPSQQLPGGSGSFEAQAD